MLYLVVEQICIYQKVWEKFFFWQIFFYQSKGKGGKREDNRDLILEAKELHGYNYIDSVTEFRRNTPLPLLGLFASKI